MNIFVVTWTEFLLVLGIVVVARSNTRGSGLYEETVTKTFQREWLPFPSPTTIKPVSNGLELESRVEEPMWIEITSRRKQGIRRNLQEQNWKTATGGIEEESSGNHGQNVMFIHNDRRWTRSATTESTERPSEPGKSKKSSHTRLSSRKDKGDQVHHKIRKKYEFAVKRHLHLLFQDKQNIIMSHTEVPPIVSPNNGGTNVKSSSSVHPLLHTNVRQSAVSSGAIQKSIREDTKPVKIPSFTNVTQVLDAEKGQGDIYSGRIADDTRSNVQHNLRHVWEIAATAEEQQSQTVISKMSLMPSMSSSFTHTKDNTIYHEILNKFPVFQQNYQPTQKSRGKRNADRQSLSVEKRKSKKRDGLKVDGERIPKNYSRDNSSSSSGNSDGHNPLGSEWEVDERDYVIHQHETKELMNTTDETYLSSGDVLKKSRDELVIIFITTHPVKLWESLGLYDNSFLNNVHSHWLQFEPASPLTFEILRAIYCLIMVCGVGGNFLVILMFIKCRSLRTPPNYLIVNLAASDGLMMLKMPIFIFNASYGGPAMGSIGCKIYGYVGGLSGTASIMTLAAIALERFTVIAYPLNPMKKTTSSKALWIVAAVWVYSIFFSTLPFFGVSGYVAEGYLTSCSFDYLSTNTSDRVFVFIFFLGAFVFPLCLIVFSYVKIFKTVRTAEKCDVFNSNGSGQASGNRESFRSKPNNKKQKTEVKIAIISCTIILVWLVAWTPYSVISLMGIFGYKDLITPLWSAIPSLFCKTAGCIDPFLYAIKHPRFQTELRAKLPFLVCGMRIRRSESYTTRSSEASYYSGNTLSRTFTSCRRNPSLSTTTYFDATSTARKQSEERSLVNASLHLTFDLREMSSLNASPNPGTKKRLKSSLKRNTRRKTERMRSNSLESSDENDKACATTTNSTSCPIPDETIHLICHEDGDEHLNYILKYSSSEESSGDQVALRSRSFGNEKRDGFNSNFDDDVNNSRMKFSRLDDSNGESKHISSLEKVEVEKITQDNKVEIDHNDDHDLRHSVRFKGQINRTKLARSESATLSSNNKVGESGRESVQAYACSKDTLVVRTERKRAGLFPYITYETSIL